MNKWIEKFERHNFQCKREERQLYSLDKVGMSGKSKTIQKKSTDFPKNINDFSTALAILLVEDDPLIQMLHYHWLIELNCLVDVASSAEEALILLRNYSYSLLLIDIHLPGMNGIELILNFCQIKPDNNTEIMALTACRDLEIIEQCFSVGIKKVLHKPITFKELSFIIQLLLQQKVDTT